MASQWQENKVLNTSQSSSTQQSVNPAPTQDPVWYTMKGLKVNFIIIVLNKISLSYYVHDLVKQFNTFVVRKLHRVTLLI